MQATQNKSKIEGNGRYEPGHVDGEVLNPFNKNVNPVDFICTGDHNYRHIQ